MTTTRKSYQLVSFDESAAAIDYSVNFFIQCANDAIKERGLFSVALSGGNTPKMIYERLTHPENRSKVDWQRAFVFWSDERSVPPDHQDSNYRMAMEAGLKTLPIPKNQIFRMQAESDIESHAAAYEALITQHLPEARFDFVMLGMGDDGHTASLFPHTEALKESKRLVLPNFVPKFKTWRMTLSFPCINASRHICVYVLGSKKEEMLTKVLSKPYQPENLPAQRIGTVENPAIWITDFHLQLPD